jgi:hypothetical protein
VVSARDDEERRRRAAQVVTRHADRCPGRHQSQHQR